jgi:hypothetical protein
MLNWRIGSKVLFLPIPLLLSQATSRKSPLLFYSVDIEKIRPPAPLSSRRSSQRLAREDHCENMTSPGDVAVVKKITGLYVYVGQTLPDNDTEHGRGIQTFTSGESEGDRYEGEWRNGNRCGYGVYTWKDGRYEGELRNGLRHGRGCQNMRDRHFFDGRFFDGEWADDFPLRGTAKETDGALSFAVFDGKTRVCSGWRKAARTVVGRVVRGRPSLYREDGGRWIGTVQFVGGERYAGELRWLRPCSGVLTEAGARFWVEYDGAAALGEGDAVGRMPSPASKEVRAGRVGCRPQLQDRVWGCWF